MAMNFFFRKERKNPNGCLKFEPQVFLQKNPHKITKMNQITKETRLNLHMELASTAPISKLNPFRSII